MSTNDMLCHENNIRVFCRVKPIGKNDIPFEYTINKDGAGKELFSMFDHNKKTNTPSTNMKFDGIFDQDATQESIYEKVASPLLHKFMDGYNSTIFSYGQTGSGKTFTIYGKNQERGLMPRLINDLFNKIQLKESETYAVQISYIEIYNKQIYNLLSLDGKKNVKLNDLKIRHNVNNYNEAMELIKKGNSRREIGATAMNSRSSRSHCVCSLYLSKEECNKTYNSKLHIVDLAGSEKYDSKNSKKACLENNNINISLFTLKRVINSIIKKNSINTVHRSSILTSFLIDSLRGPCFTTMIANIAVEERWMKESLSTCNFAQELLLVKNETNMENKRTMNSSDSDELIYLKNELEIMKTRNNELKDVFDQNRQLVNEKCQLVNENCQLVNENRQLVNENCQLNEIKILQNKECHNLIKVKDPKEMNIMHTISDKTSNVIRTDDKPNMSLKYKNRQLINENNRLNDEIKLFQKKECYYLNKIKNLENTNIKHTTADKTSNVMRTNKIPNNIVQNRVSKELNEENCNLIKKNKQLDNEYRLLKNKEYFNEDKIRNLEKVNLALKHTLFDKTSNVTEMTKNKTKTLLKKSTNVLSSKHLVNENVDVKSPIPSASDNTLQKTTDLNSETEMNVNVSDLNLDTEMNESDLNLETEINSENIVTNVDDNQNGSNRISWMNIFSNIFKSLMICSFIYWYS